MEPGARREKWFWRAVATSIISTSIVAVASYLQQQTAALSYRVVGPAQYQSRRRPVAAYTVYIANGGNATADNVDVMVSHNNMRFDLGVSSVPPASGRVVAKAVDGFKVQFDHIAVGPLHSITFFADWPSMKPPTINLTADKNVVGVEDPNLR